MKLDNKKNSKTANNDGGRNVLTTKNKILLDTVNYSRNKKCQTISTICITGSGGENIFK